jgi:4-aminobutyrate aminotransferase-like enzyme
MTSGAASVTSRSCRRAASSNCRPATCHCHDRGFLFFTTHVCHPLAAAVACTVLAVVERDALVARAAELGTQLGDRLTDMKEHYEQVGERLRSRAAPG